MEVEITLDAREMVPPEPFEQATAILHRLEEGQYLRMLHRRIPYPLLDHARDMSMESTVTEIDPSQYEVIIYFAADERRLREGGVL